MNAPTEKFRLGPKPEPATILPLNSSVLRSADWQSAVSPVANRLTIRIPLHHQFHGKIDRSTVHLGHLAPPNMSSIASTSLVPNRHHPNSLRKVRDTKDMEGHVIFFFVPSPKLSSPFPVSCFLSTLNSFCSLLPVTRISSNNTNFFYDDKHDAIQAITRP